MIESLYVGFWTLTYVLIIIAGFMSKQERLVSMPYIAGILNLAWEICAVLTTPSFWGYYPWLALDFIIAYLGYRFLKTRKERILYLLTIVFVTACLFLAQFLAQNTLVYSVYAIDLVMAIIYLYQRNLLSPKLKLSIGITRFLGDLFAGIEVLVFSLESLSWIVIAVWVCNTVYLVLTVMQKFKKPLQD